MEILYPMFAVISLSGVMFLFLTIERVSLIFKHFRNLKAAKHSDELRPNLPSLGSNITNNYNHLFEQPTIFYALIIYIYLLQHADDIHIYIAWIYAGLRILHSIVQMTTNYIPLRAGLFICSGMCLIAMIVREGLFLLG